MLFTVHTLIPYTFMRHAVTFPVTPGFPPFEFKFILFSCAPFK